MTSVLEIVKTTVVDVSATQLTMPLPIILLLAWTIGVLLTTLTLPVGIICLRKEISVTRIIASSRITVFGTHLASLCSIINLLSALTPMRTITNITLMLLCSALFAGELQNESPDIDAELDMLRTMKNNLPNSGRARLAFLEYQKADRELSMVCQMVLDRINTSGIPDYGIKQWIEQEKSSQRAWIKFHEEDSKVLDYAHWGGSGAGIFMLEWKIKITQTRIQHLRERYHIKETERSQTSEPAAARDGGNTAP